jgi:hypothetical protein
MLVGLAPVVGLAAAQPPAAPATTPAAQGVTPQMAPTTDWIEFDDATVTPVVDDVSAHLAQARRALAANDRGAAASALQAAAQALQQQADRVGQLERRRAAADMPMARQTHARMAALVRRLQAAAAQVESGRLTTTAQLDESIDKASRADLERRWLVSDVGRWYPLVDAPQQHFERAAALVVRRDARAAAAELRRASAYLRLESARAAGDAAAGLAEADAALDRTALALQRGKAVSESSLHAVFARADHALAVAHRARAAEAWSRKAYDRAGYELKAAAQGLEAAAAWTDDQSRAAAARTVEETRALGDKLVRGGVWAKDEVAHGFDALERALNRVGHEIGAGHAARPFDTGV